jgi:thiol-disulfide isomerase/thioredoxin
MPKFLTPILLAAITVCAGCLPVSSFAQHVSGTLAPSASSARTIKLLVSRGGGTRAIDSTRIDASGRFTFAERAFPIGFYALALNDSDQVDLILNPQEKAVQLEFAGIPLQQNIRVLRSDENKRLWDYKVVSRQSQAIQASAMAEKRDLRVNDVRRMFELDSIVGKAMELQQAHLQAILKDAPDSFFGKVVRTDRDLGGAEGANPLAVLRVFDFSDPGLMRSSVYDKAVITFLKNIRATSEEQFLSASDTLIAYASRDPECKAYMLDHLIDLYSTFGPDLALQHLIDRYVVTADGLQQISPALRDRVKELLKVAVGATGPDVELPAPGAPVPLRSIVEKARYTALFFYASTCDHCHQEMPILKEAYQAYHAKGFEVVGIALDADSSEFTNCIQEEALPWPCFSEFIGWGAKAVKAYQVKATPWFYLLDERMRIVAKPTNATMLRDWLQEHLP